ncbi:hypothetical protein EVAR_67494_1 [Eumeta japonica]|uniref:Uncharacterized protein n=1 Tax=Eumeta variegata TaxID=151549 RepID=A0A4C1ZH68_EUMVA|nr:hypothetical protein EVAR_67494_1 [Eumeta japonica]
MPIFKVCRHDKLSERKMVKATTMDELLQVAKLKLALTDDKYKLQKVSDQVNQVPKQVNKSLLQVANHVVRQPTKHQQDKLKSYTGF